MEDTLPERPSFAMYVEEAAKAGATIRLAPRHLPNSSLIALDAQFEKQTRPLERHIWAERTFIVNGVLVTPAPT
jgi:hypothetical protein